MDQGARRFDTTRWSLVLRAAGGPTAGSRGALGELCRLYREPLRAFARHLVADAERAEDVVQGFFAHLLAAQTLDDVSASRGRFRAFLRRALRNYVINAHEAETAQKRGGGVRFVAGDPDDFAGGDPSLDRLCDRLWTRRVIDLALARLDCDMSVETAGKQALFEALRDRLLDEGGASTLRAVGATLEMSESAVKLALFRLRQRLHELVREQIAETVERPEDVDAELAELISACGVGE